MSELEVTEVASEEVPAELTPDPVELLQAEVDSLKDQFLRAKAETENIRKRNIEEVVKARKFAIEEFANSLLSVADSLYAAAESDKSTGVNMTLQQLLSAFEKHNLKQIDPNPTDAFNPHQHQAISAVESDQEPNTVVAVFQKGYIIADRVLRPAMVTVSKEKQNVREGEQSETVQREQVDV